MWPASASTAMPSGRRPPVAMIFLSDPSGLTENTRPSARSRMNKRLDMCFPFVGAQCDEMAELLLLRAQVGEGLRRGPRLASNACDDIEAGVLQLVGTELRDEADAAAFAIVVDDQPAVFGGDDAHGERELLGAIAAQRPEHLSGHALRLQAHERRAAAELAMNERQRAFNAVGSVALEAERLERAPACGHLGASDLPERHRVGAVCFFGDGM